MPLGNARGCRRHDHHPEVHLWESRPGTPYLYTLHITCGVDVYDQTFGVRED